MLHLNKMAPPKVFFSKCENLMAIKSCISTGAKHIEITLVARDNEPF